MRDLIIFGNSIFAEVAIYYFSNFSKYKVCYVSCEKKYKKNFFDNNIEQITLEEALKKNKKKYQIFIAIGYSKMNTIRQKFYSKFKLKGFKMANFIHPSSSVLSKKIGDNNFIMDNVSINPFTAIGNNNIFWSGNIIGHHCNIGNSNFFSGNSTISGSCKIKDNNFFGVNTSTKDGITVGKKCFIDANQHISKNLPDEIFFNKEINPKLILKTSQIFN
tara:strand:- start:398 stop:1051 length:654 start_codon:yes stop_codon:yes gene_type:complete